ncbi:cytochrome c1 [Pseudomonas sp. CFBP 8770]|uniref:cytochrome c1 n=1 Tax=unclassified Pseudomonas TaxID=196821 RepID=UPI0017815639|nr:MULTISPECIES: cytochrome c1 [unclassified Pseudomonas]MBD8475949.1 cytochrome c1 [Pseudomonas sp. CFBP 8773]MBD8648668.1 cytochrome c1 [Pseudomonas sp. CFBP 8770]
MKIWIAVLLLLALPPAWADPVTPLVRPVAIEVSDKAALRDGASTFVGYCMGCHGARFQRYQAVADDLGIPYEQMLQTLAPAGAAIADHMQTRLQPADAKAWFGAEVPDLTLVARVRGTDWLYAYLQGFHADAARPWGVNNIVYPNVGMPNVLESLQGRQVLDCAEPAAQPCTRLRVIPGTGSLDAAQFDDKVRNLVAFLAYSAEPVKARSQRIGLYVLLYLALLIVLAYLLKREYWKDVG